MSAREEELAALIAEQEKDMRRGHRVAQTFNSSPHGADPIDWPRRRVLANDSRHGTHFCYSALLCRCEKCRAAWAEYCLELKRWRRPEAAKSHGRESTYINYGCRCDLCRDAANRARRRRAAA